MSLEPLRPRRFGSETAVAAYWISRCDGFRAVIGHREVGTVEHTVFREDPLDPIAFRVRRRRRTRLVPLGQLEAVEPLSRVLYFSGRRAARARLEPRSSAAGTHLRRIAARTAAAGIAFSRWAVPAFGDLMRALARAAARSWPSLRRLLSTTATIVLAILVACAKLLLLSATALLSALAFAARELLALTRSASRRLADARAQSPPAEHVSPRRKRELPSSSTHLTVVRRG